MFSHRSTLAISTTASISLPPLSHPRHFSAFNGGYNDLPQFSVLPSVPRLKKKIHQSLPNFTYDSVDSAANAKLRVDCTICLLENTSGDQDQDLLRRCRALMFLSSSGYEILSKTKATVSF